MQQDLKSPKATHSWGKTKEIPSGNDDAQNHTPYQHSDCHPAGILQTQTEVDQPGSSASTPNIRTSEAARSSICLLSITTILWILWKQQTRWKVKITSFKFNFKWQQLPGVLIFRRFIDLRFFIVDSKSRFQRSTLVWCLVSQPASDDVLLSSNWLRRSGMYYIAGVGQKCFDHKMSLKKL